MQQPLYFLQYLSYNCSLNERPSYSERIIAAAQKLARLKPDAINFKDFVTGSRERIAALGQRISQNTQENTQLTDALQPQIREYAASTLAIISDPEVADYLLGEKKFLSLMTLRSSVDNLFSNLISTAVVYMHKNGTQTVRFMFEVGYDVGASVYVDRVHDRFLLFQQQIRALDKTWQTKNNSHSTTFPEQYGDRIVQGWKYKFDAIKPLALEDFTRYEWLFPNFVSGLESTFSGLDTRTQKEKENLQTEEQRSSEKLQNVMMEGKRLSKLLGSVSQANKILYDSMKEQGVNSYVIVDQSEPQAQSPQPRKGREKRK